MVAQVDQLIMSSVEALEGRAEVEMVRKLLRLRDSISRKDEGSEFAGEVSEAQADAMGAVDEYFERVLTGVPEIKTYLDGVAAGRPG